MPKNVAEFPVHGTRNEIGHEAGVMSWGWTHGAPQGSGCGYGSEIRRLGWWLKGRRMPLSRPDLAVRPAMDLDMSSLGILRKKAIWGHLY